MNKTFIAVLSAVVGGLAGALAGMALAERQDSQPAETDDPMAPIVSDFKATAGIVGGDAQVTVDGEVYTAGADCFEAAAARGGADVELEQIEGWLEHVVAVCGGSPEAVGTIIAAQALLEGSLNCDDFTAVVLATEFSVEMLAVLGDYEAEFATLAPANTAYAPPFDSSEFRGLVGFLLDPWSRQVFAAADIACPQIAPALSVSDGPAAGGLSDAGAGLRVTEPPDALELQDNKALCEAAGYTWDYAAAGSLTVGAYCK